MPSECSRLLIAGVGGHGRVVADAWLEGHPRAEVMGFDDATTWHGRAWFADSICLGSVALMKAHMERAPVHLAIGGNAIRKRMALVLGLSASNWESVVHPRACVSAHAVVREGAFVAAQAVLAPQSHIGRGVIVNHAAVVDHDVTVGDFCHIAPGVVLGGGVQVGARVLVGAGAVVLPGVSICDDAVIGAGAVVVRDVTRPGVWRGVPAQEH